MRLNLDAFHDVLRVCMHMVILIIRETKSCIDIDGSCMLINLQSRREGVQNDRMISVVPQYAYLKCVHQNCDSCSSYKL